MYLRRAKLVEKYKIFYKTKEATITKFQTVIISSGYPEQKSYWRRSLYVNVRTTSFFLLSIPVLETLNFETGILYQSLAVVLTRCLKLLSLQSSSSEYRHDTIELLNVSSYSLIQIGNTLLQILNFWSENFFSGVGVIMTLLRAHQLE